VTPSGTRKAALLLMSLDAGTAAELLKSVQPESATEIAAELALLEKPHPHEPEALAPVQEFYGLLRRDDGDRDTQQFVREVLENAMGKQRSEHVLGQVQQILESKDPFRNVRLAEADDIARALAAEPPSAVALVLSELPPAKSSQVLSLLDEAARPAAVCNLAGGAVVSPEIRLRVASVLQSRLQQLAADRQTGVVDVGRDQHLRKLAVLLRGMKKELRDELIAALSKKNEEDAAAVQKLMVLWEDIVLMADRDLQEVLRQVEARQLALALTDTDERTIKKVRSNISERAGALLDEEASLLSAPTPEEIEQAREAILETIRETNAQGEMTFEEPA